MGNLTEVFDFPVSALQDERARLVIRPQRIVVTKGQVTGAEALLSDRPFQAILGGEAACTMENDGSSNSEKAGILLDFGREVEGFLLLTTGMIPENIGRASVRIRFGESAMEALSPIGHKNATNDHAVRDHLYDIGSLGTLQTNESGFRFAWIGLEDETAVLPISAVHVCMLYRDVPYLGSFASSDPLLDRIYKTAAYTVHLNMQNYLWDGIKRDRLAWQGDLHTEVLTVGTVFGANPVVSKSLDFLRDATPEGEWINGYSSYSIWWILVQASWYRFTGDLAYLKQQHAFLLTQLAHMAEYLDENGKEILPQFRFLDWKNLPDPAATHAGLQALMRLGFMEGAFLLSAMGDAREEEKARAMADRMKAYVPDPHGSKQAAALLALAGLADAKEMNENVISPGGAHGYSTFMGYYLLAAKAEARDYCGALDDLRSYWGGMLSMAATTFWEDFDLDWMENAAGIDEIVPEGKVDIHGDYGAFCYQKYRHSLCHGWSSGPVPFLSQYVLGIQIAEPGCRKLIIEPHLGDLDWAKGTFATPYGVVEVSHKKQADGTVKTSFAAPDGVEIILK